MTTMFSFLRILCTYQTDHHILLHLGLRFPGGSCSSDLLVSSGYGPEQAMPKRCADKVVKTAREARREGVLHQQQRLPSTWQKPQLTCSHLHGTSEQLHSNSPCSEQWRTLFPCSPCSAFLLLLTFLPL